MRSSLRCREHAGCSCTYHSLTSRSDGRNPPSTANTHTHTHTQRTYKIHGMPTYPHVKTHNRCLHRSSPLLLRWCSTELRSEPTASSAVPPARPPGPPGPQDLLSSFGFSGSFGASPLAQPFSLPRLVLLTSMKLLSLRNRPPPSAPLTAASANMLSCTVFSTYPDRRLTVSRFPT